MRNATIIAFLSLFLLAACATRTRIEYRDRDVNHYITNTIHDTLINNTRDSIYVEVLAKGDTIWRTKYVEKTKWRDRAIERHDTCWRDSIVVEYKENVKEVTRVPKIYKFSLLLSILCIIFVFIKLARWLKRN